MRKLLLFSLILTLCSNICLAKDVLPIEDKGYMGTLPELGKKFQSSEPVQGKPVFDKAERFNSSDKIKPVPRDNPSFVNIILKTDKTSAYLNDLAEFLPILEKIYNSIEKKDDVQKFTASVYFFNKNADWLRDKYEGKPESEFISFKKLMDLSLHTQAVSNLRAEAVKYTPYLAYSGTGYIYNAGNIDEQLDYLKIEIEQAIIAIKEAE